MNVYSWLAIYSLAILLLSVAGGSVPFLGRVSHDRLQLYLSLSAGVMLGAAFFHVMPDAMELAGGAFGWWMSLGAVGLFCIERFIAPHSHELDGGHHHHHHHHHDHAHQDVAKEAEHALAHGHIDPPTPAATSDRRAAAPPVAGWMAVLGLTLHTFMNGVGLAGAVQAAADAAQKADSSAVLWLPGLALFLAIFLHKPADALAISTVLSRKGVSRSKIALVQVGFALMVPVGAAAFMLTHGAIAKDLESQLTGAALAFSAGTFLFIALSDLMPEIQFHRHDRVPLFLSLVAGILLMGGIAYLEEQGGEHKHGGHGDEAGEVENHDHHHDATHGHDESQHEAK